MQRIGVLVAQTDRWARLLTHLEQSGYSVAVAAPDPEPLGLLLDAHDPDVILIELGSGLFALHHLHAQLRRRADAKPLVVVGLAQPEHLRPAHFVVGVDEFVLPPYDPDEVLARVQLALWRAKRIDTQHSVRLGALQIDLEHRTVRLRGQAVELTDREYDLLAFLAEHRGRPFSRDALLRHVWGYTFEGGDRVVDKCISRLRDKLGHPYDAAIETVRRLGYRLAESIPASDYHRTA